MFIEELRNSKRQGTVSLQTLCFARSDILKHVIQQQGPSRHILLVERASGLRGEVGCAIAFYRRPV